MIHEMHNQQQVGGTNHSIRCRHTQHNSDLIHTHLHLENKCKQKINYR